MSDAEWRALTPRLLLARMEQKREIERTTNLRVGMVLAQITNTMRGKSTDRVWTAEDFFPAEDVLEESTVECDVDGILRMMRGIRPGLN